MSKIKLYKLDEHDNIIRLQSQLSVGKDTVDFILDNGVLMNWCYGKGGDVGFHECNIPYEIVEDVEEMKTQEL